MKKIAIVFILTFILLISTLLTWLYSQVDSALPQLEGKQTLLGLSHTVNVARDEQGIPTLTASNRLDIAVATGFIHAQERFFQMDLLRKNAAGELSSLFGIAALSYDKNIRKHRFRERARTIVNQLPLEQYKILQAYTRGVNQGLKYLHTSPFEYLLLRLSPVEWQEEDTILTVFSMYIDLQPKDGKRELTLAAIASSLGPDIYNFLNPKGSMWDAAIDNTRYQQSAMPNDFSVLNADITELSAQHLGDNTVDATQSYQDGQFPGSNNWAVSGDLTATGSAIVANDMHLGIRVPNTWFRAQFKYQHNNMPVEVTGLTLPGTPNMVVGSNSKIAWGFTNSYGDWSDVILLETNQDNSEYLTPNGFVPFTFHKQMIAIKGDESIEYTIKETQWGPVIGENEQGQLLAYRWVAHDKNAVNLSHLNLEFAHTVDDAFDIATTAGIPAQNLMVADHLGNIGWTIMGPMPKKTDQIDQLPTSWSNGENAWTGYLEAHEYPRIKNPEHGRLWTANSRVVGDKLLKKIGNGGYALGARSSQIKAALMAKSAFNESDLLDIALDDRALFLQRWQRFIMIEVLTEQAVKAKPQWAEVKTLLAQDNLRATTDSVAYRLVRSFRLNVRDALFETLNDMLNKQHEHYQFRSIRHQIEPAMWQLINEKPSHFFLTENKLKQVTQEQAFAKWQTLLNDALVKTLKDMTEDQTLAEATWGQINTSTIRHPLSQAVPFIGKWLDMPKTQLPGDSYMPRVQGPSFGASERMVVSPGYEENGYLHMPTSQAGHPWSPYYKKGHSDWEQGKMSPFLPGKTKYMLTLHSY